jgi:hypothetical protein
MEILKMTHENETTATAEARPVLITTEYRGVFFGYTTDTSGDTVVLENTRNCIFWSRDVGGFLGLASTGPTASCRIGDTVSKGEVRKVTGVWEVSPDAELMWKNAPVYRG